ncbi:MAG: hypothetical protein MI866_13030 [Bacteroidales bacterium]|nr:hypothetical protein [Bacteroidales bacterium]
MRLSKFERMIINKRFAKTVLLILSLFYTLINSYGQSKSHYEYAFNEICKMLNGDNVLDFKKAVFITENAFHSGQLDYGEFCERIVKIEGQLRQFMTDKNVFNHPMGKQFAIFSFMMEPSVYNQNIRMTYDFEDLTGRKDWTKMFVTKLLDTNTGNCHSLPYLYKILAEEIEADAFLALGPNHMYIKHKDDKGMWVNVELTNGSFPRDGWIASSLSITTEAIKKETYMEPLSLKESIALCLYDLTLGYQFQFGHDDFGIKCCDAITEYYPTCIYAYMVKSEILAEKRNNLLSLEKNSTLNDSKINELEKTILQLYETIDQMGYKEMPKEQYENWLKEVNNEKVKLSKQ